ncbi:glycosyltransferase family 2 protein [Vibrio breoganii]|uniref:glycosyltransferase family 2 protein n=1 Tax=Vibrio breoganii TaxID=553239 RepID=UPI000C8483C1|nr:glycosyltransferase family 2 protein [Vibrio breoganii]PML40464.1 hypothetical protein BCT77_07295 [Vibrio breoganii]PMO77622.1 hypothetical protein BCT02_07320 [Vibrio breoganii]PMO86533.1 hypothetical protein BCS99_11320 [Vibrio breoganii]
MSISVVIPSYNSADYIIEALDSIAKHNESDFEVIVVDDGSTDNTRLLVSDYASRDPRVRYIYQENKGQSIARNVGYTYASKDYILFMDSDDTHESGSLDRLYNLVTTDMLDGLFFEARNLDEMDGKSGINFDYSRPDSEGVNLATGRELFVEFISKNTLTVSPCLYLIRREVLSEIRFLPGIHYEDNLYTFQVLMSKKLKRCKVINEIFYNRRIRHGSIMTGEKTNKHLEGYYQVYLSVTQFLKVNKRQLDSELLICVLRFKARLLYKVSLALMETKNLYTYKGIRLRGFLYRQSIINARYLKLSQILSIIIPDINLVRGLL